MRSSLLAYALAVVAFASRSPAADPAPEMRQAAEKFLALLTPEQKQKAALAYDSPLRSDWHWVPKPTRKGLPLKEMTPPQRVAALALLRTGVSESGYRRARYIFDLEGVLHVTEKYSAVRDPGKYYFTIFGTPSATGVWSWSAEGHHLSLNYTCSDDKLATDTPTFFGTNPRVVDRDLAVGPPIGTRNIDGEDQIALKLAAALTAEQKAKSLVDRTAPKYLVAGTTQTMPQPKTPVGLAVKDMTAEQKTLVHELLLAYLANVPEDVKRRRIDDVEKAGFDAIHLAWFGSFEQQKGYFYRLQGPTFIVEFDNTQPDNYGHPAGHIHSAWRKPGGDFAAPGKTTASKRSDAALEK